MKLETESLLKPDHILGIKYKQIVIMESKLLQKEAYCISDIHCGRYNVMMIEIADFLEDYKNTIIHNNIYEIYNFFQERIKDICSRHKAFKPIEIFDEWGLEKDHVTFCGEEEFEQEGGWWFPEEVIRIDLSKVTKEMSL